MKRKFAVLTMCVCLFCAACGAEETVQTKILAETTGEPTTVAAETAVMESTQEVSLQDIYDEMENSVELPPMVVLNDNYIANYYGIDLSLLEEYIFANAEDVIYADTVILMKVKEEASAQSMVDALNRMIDQKKLELENYLPEQYKLVEKSEVKVAGKNIYLVISEKADELTSVITQYFQ